MSGVSLGTVLVSLSSALLVAVVTAVFAERRQRSALAAERERLDRQLRHERAAADREDLRALLDEAGKHVYRLVEASSTAFGVWNDISSASSEEEKREGLEAWRAFTSVARQAQAVDVRLAVRLGEDNSVRKALIGFRREMRKDVRSWVQIGLSAEERKAAHLENRAAITAYREEFIKGVTDLVGSELDLEDLRDEATKDPARGP